LPAGRPRHRDISDVAIDSGGRVYALTRGPAQVLVYDEAGTVAGSWGEDGLSVRPHGIAVGPSGGVYIADQYDNAVRRYSPEGEPELTIGALGGRSDTGADPSLPEFYDRIASIRRGGTPFNEPTSVAVADDGELYVADGYGNARVHHFTSDGTLIQSWGQPGGGPGEFRIPHDIVVLPDDRVLVVDRENERIQIFDRRGTFLEAWPSQRPSSAAVDANGRIVVAELGWHKGQRSWNRGTIERAVPPRVTFFDVDGRIAARLEASDFNSRVRNSVTTPHGIAVDSSGALYIAQVVDPPNDGGIDPDREPLQKWMLHPPA
jgi:sugar lactone lactonase YvrE